MGDVNHICTTEPTCLCSSSADDCDCLTDGKTCRSCQAEIIAIDIDTGEPIQGSSS